MIAFHVVVVSVLALGEPGVGDAPLAWSPDGEWLAFTVSTVPAGRSLSGFPLLPEADGAEPVAPQGGPPERTYRLWAVRVDDARAIKIAEGSGPMTSPAWGPGGRGLAFGRVTTSEGGDPPVWEVVIAYGEEREVIARRPLEPGADRGSSLLNEPVAWEPGEGLLAVPEPDRIGLEVIDLDRRETVRRIEGARLASFSPMGGDLAFFRSRADRWELVEARVDAGPELDRPIDLVDLAVQAPVWTSDGRAVLYLKQHLTGEGMQVSLFMHRILDAEPERVKEVESAAMPGEPVLGAYLSVSRDGFDQYYCVPFGGRPTAISYHRGSHPIDRIFAFGGLGRLGAPVLDPSGDRIAIRFGGPGPDSVVGLLDPDTDAMTPMTPDLESTAAWVSALGRAIDLPDSASDRPTRLPFPIELEQSGGLSPSNKKLARLGSRLVEELARTVEDGSVTVPPALVFSYLQGDYDEAERLLGTLPPSPEPSDRSLRLLGLRAQICLARGEGGQAEEIIDFIREQQRQGVARVEPDGSGGFSVSRDVEGEVSWPDRLWKLSRGEPLAKPEEPQERSPGTPQPRAVPRTRPVRPKTASPTEGDRPGGG